jgi:ferric-dicitrate binding protein FerR (iron transport regulator)
VLEEITDTIISELRRHRRLLLKPNETPDSYTVAGTLDVRQVAMALEVLFEDWARHAENRGVGI